MSISGAAGGLFAYKMIRMLSQKYEDWDAYKLGIIDKEGKTIKSPKTTQEKASFGAFERLARNIKNVFMMAPLGFLRIASLAVALRLLREHTESEGMNADKVENTILEYLVYNHIGFITESTYEDSSPIEPGKYEDFVGNVYIVMESVESTETYMNIPLYKLKTATTREYMWVAKDALKPLNHK
jgi:hypothetical protein